MEMQDLQDNQANQTNENPQNPQCTIYENFQATGIQSSQANQTNENPQNLQSNVYEEFQPTGSRRSRNSGQETASNGKMSRVKTILLVVCLIVTIASASATIALFIKMMNNEKLLEKNLNQLNTLSANCKDTSFQEKVDRSLKEVKARLNEIRDNSNTKLQSLEEKLETKSRQVNSHLNNTTDKTVHIIRSLEEKFDMRLNKVDTRLNDTNDNSISKLRSAQEKVDMKLNELGARLNDTTNSNIHEFQVIKEKVDMKLNEVGSRLNDTIENSTSRLRSVEEKVDLKLNEVCLRLNDNKNETLHELKGLEGKVGMKLSAFSARLNETDSSISKLQNFNHSLSLLESKLNAAKEEIDCRLTILSRPENCSLSNEDGRQLLSSGENVYCHKHWRWFGTKGPSDRDSLNNLFVKVIQRRFNGQVIFHIKNWNEYKNGFGNLSTEFWIGLDKMHKLTRNGGCRLRVELGAFDGSEAYAEYREFSIGNESNLFRLHISGYSGTAGDAIMHRGNDNNNMDFTTIDRDNDRYSSINCAAYKGGGLGAWWFNSCGYAYLNGRYKENLNTYTSFTWYQWKRAYITLKSSMMMIRCD